MKIKTICTWNCFISLWTAFVIKIGSTQSTATAGAIHNDFETISDAQEALWFVKENIEKTSCPKKKRTIIGNENCSNHQPFGAGNHSLGDFEQTLPASPGNNNTYTKYSSELELYRGDIVPHNNNVTLRRSRSLAITREDIYTDLSLGGRVSATRSRRSQLIPRARLIDKGSVQGSRSCFPQIDPSSQRSSIVSRNSSIHNIPHSASEQIPIPQKLDKIATVLGSWPNHHDIVRSYPQFAKLHPDQIYARYLDPIIPSQNPSEIDSLDSNFQNKSTLYSNNVDSDDYTTTFYDYNQPYNQLYVNNLGLSLPNYYPDSIYDTDISLSQDNNSLENVPVNDAITAEVKLNVYESTTGENDANFEELEISARTTREKHPNVTPLYFHSAPSTDNQIAADCFEEIPLVEKNSPPPPRLIYSQLDFKPTIVGSNLKQKPEVDKSNETTYEQVIPKPIQQPSKVKNFLNKNFKSVFSDAIKAKKSELPKLISTEPYVSTFLENQCIDVAISKSLQKSARIDAKLRQQIDHKSNNDDGTKQDDKNRRFVVNIGPHINSLVVPVKPESETPASSTVNPETPATSTSTPITSKPIILSEKCNIPTSQTVKSHTSLDIKLNTFEDEIKLPSPQVTIAEKSSVDSSEKTITITEHPQSNNKKITISSTNKRPEEENAKPICISLTRINSTSSTNDYNQNFKPKRSMSFDKETNTSKSIEMPRPQILSVTEKTTKPKTPEASQLSASCDNLIASIPRNCEDEYEQKLQSIKCYWDQLSGTTKNQKKAERVKRSGSLDLSNHKPFENTSKNLPRITDEIPKRSNHTPEPKLDEPSTKVNEKDDTNESPPIENVEEISPGIIKNVCKIFEPESNKQEEEQQELESQVEKVRKLFEPEPTPTEESKMGAFVKESCSFFERAYGTLKKSFSNNKPPTIEEENHRCRNSTEKNEMESTQSAEHRSNNHLQLRKTRSYDDEQEFDHIRYKVMKSNLFQKNIISNCKREAQFDGLMQYLQDYSFQELLINNNVVIIEPVRTKIEPNRKQPPDDKPPLSRISNNSGNTNRKISINSDECDDPILSPKSQNGKKKSGNLKKHFFYHPIRVNRELIEEELPDPETVRKVRTFFEKEFGEEIKLKKSQSSKNLSDTKAQRPRKRVLRYLTVDTNLSKWDSGSVSSGVSSGGSFSDFDSPKLHNNGTNENLFSSDENFCEEINGSGDYCYDASVVSQDVLKKIRECGTSITYYGGKVLDAQNEPIHNNNNGHRNPPLTSKLLEEIKALNKDNAEKNGDAHQSPPATIVSNPQPPNQSTLAQKCNQRGTYQGIKFKLVKSNSCSSRLELIGTEKTESLAQKYFNQKRKSYNDAKLAEAAAELKARQAQQPTTTTNDNQTVSQIPQDNNNSNINNNDESRQITLQPTISEYIEKFKANNDKNGQFVSKTYHVNAYEDLPQKTAQKFGEMVFEPFEVAESLSLNKKNEA